LMGTNVAKKSAVKAVREARSLGAVTAVSRNANRGAEEKNLGIEILVARCIMAEQPLLNDIETWFVPMSKRANAGKRCLTDLEAKARSGIRSASARVATCTSS
ncbi:11402_t:CDS:2, partial [Acaulospora colombiana]